MGRVTTNSISLQYCREQTPGVLPTTPKWRELEPNSVKSFGGTITKTVRSPISSARQRRKGIVTDTDSGVEFDCDATLDAIKDYMEGFCFCRAIGPDSYEPTAAVSTGFTVSALTSAQAGRLLYGASSATTLIYARGWTNPANNGLKPLSGAMTTSATTLLVAGNVAETPAATATVAADIAGVRGAAGDLKIDSSGNLTSIVLDFTTLGLSPGQFIHVGGLDVLHQFHAPANLGFARIVSITAHLIVLAKKLAAFVTDDGTDTGSGGTGVRVDLLFGQFIRTVPVGHVDYVETTYQFELDSPNLGTAGVDNYEYALSNYADAFTLDIPLTGKATLTLGFQGTKTTLPSASRATNAANAKNPTETAAFGTASDIARLRIEDVDESGLTTDFKSMKLTISNNVAGEKVIGTLGPKYMNAGNIEVDVDTSILFTNPNVLERIRCNKTVGWDFALLNSDGGAYFDIPSATLDGGNRDFPLNQTVALSTKVQAYQDATLGFSLSVSLFPALPQQVCS